MPQESTTAPTALVTGGAGGIGRAVCRRLAARGVTVALVDREVEIASAAASEIPGSVPFAADLTDPEAIVDLVSRVHEKVGAVHTLVNNAGVTLVQGFLENDDSSWDHQWAVNLRAPMQLTRLVLPAMVERGRGRLVHVSSDGARAGSAGEAVYSACKAGLLGFTKSIAREVACHGITSNAVCPGPTDTPMLRAVESERPHLIEALTRAVPLGRLASVDDVAGVVDFLAGDDAAYVTGQTYSVSGGITMF